MFTISRDTELTTDLLFKMINKFNVSVKPQLQTFKDYYSGKQNIKNKTYTDENKPCSRAVTNFCKNITDNYCGYIASPGYISYSSNDDISEIMEVLKYNDYQDEDSSFLLDALTYGTAAELMYVDTEAKVRFKLINPLNCFGIFDDSLTNDLLYFVRFYLKNEWDNSQLYALDVYSSNSIKHYEMNGNNGALTFISEEPHYFAQCPANIFYLPDEKSIFDCIKDLQDSYNEALNNEIDEYSEFVDSYLCLTSVDADEDDIAQMKENRVLLLPEGASANWLTKTASDTQTENILKRLHESIYRVAQCPDFSNLDFSGGVSSGIALQFRLTNMENRAAKIAALMKKALLRRIEVISGIASLTLGEDIITSVDISFKRNIPEDVSATINLINALKGSVSDKTLLAQLPFIDDVESEIEALAAQKKANMELFSFGNKEEEEE